MVNRSRFVGIHGAALREQVRFLLQASGLDFTFSDDMDRFVSLMDGWEAFVHPKFRAAHYEQAGSRFLAIHPSSEPNDVLGVIAWNVFETHDYETELRDGKAWVRDPWAHGWEPMKVRLPVKLSGRLHFRGGLRVIRTGMRLSWYLTTLHESYFTEDRADYIVAHATPEIMKSGLPDWLYSYRHSHELPRHRLSWEGRWNNLTLLWSSQHEVAYNVEVKTMWLRSRGDDDLVHTVDVFEALHKADE